MKNPISQLNFLFFSTLIAILIWMASPGVKATERLPEYEAHYNLQWFSIKAGQSVQKLTQRNNVYCFETRSSPRLAFLPYAYLERSQFSWEKGQIKPKSYYYRIKEGKRYKTGLVEFNWKTNQVTNKKLQPPWQAKLTPHTQDKLTQLLSLRQALKAGHLRVDYLVAEEDKIKSYRFKVIGETVITTKLGAMPSVQVQHTSSKGYLTNLWLAKNLDYLPIKMTQIRHGKQVASAEIIFLHFPDKIS